MEGERPAYIRLITLVEPGKVAREYVLLLHRDGFNICEREKLVLAVADGGYTDFHLSSGRKLTASRTLGDFEDFLCGFGFYRISKSAIINLQHVRGYQKPQSRGAGGKVKLSNNEWYPISRRRKKGFLEMFGAGEPDED